MEPKRSRARWGIDTPQAACRRCHRNEFPHRARGLCIRCVKALKYMHKRKVNVERYEKHKKAVQKRDRLPATRIKIRSRYRGVRGLTAQVIELRDLVLRQARRLERQREHIHRLERQIKGAPAVEAEAPGAQ